MFTGLIDLAESDDQLAVIIAHEMSHVLLSHEVNSFNRLIIIDHIDGS